MNYLLADATDFVHGDVRLDGITGTMKLAHAAESLGMDVEIHLGDPPTRHCLAAIRNSNYYEWGLVHPKLQGHSHRTDHFPRPPPARGWGADP